ncbi:MAG: cation-translocating P-type ATPase [Chloroflexota bacterium]
MNDPAASEQRTPIWSEPHELVLDRLHVRPERGLSSDDVARRRREFGPNALRLIEQRSWLQILLDQFRSLVVGLLAIAAVTALLYGQLLEGAAIGVVLVLNAAIGFATELRARRSMEALRSLSQVQAVARRDGERVTLAAEDLVPGDILLIDAGDVVSADVRLLEASRLQADESALTGESTPVGKHVAVLAAETPLAERSNMLFKGTGITRGSAVGVVCATGMRTELGRISELVEQAEEELTPLEHRLNRLGHKLIWVTLALAVGVTMSGYLGGEDLFLILETGIALAVAAVPEGLPVIATIAMARGLRRMAQRNALIRRLSSVETLGATTIICTDKTGTLTENRLFVVQVVTAEGTFDLSSDLDGDRTPLSHDGHTTDTDEHPGLEQALQVGVLCNDATLRDDSAHGDPVEVALLEAGERIGISRSERIEQMPEVAESAFDPAVRMMATVHQVDGGYYYAVKGGPEAVLNASTSVQGGDDIHPLDDEERTRWLTENERQASRGLRVLAMAYKLTESPDLPPYQNLVFLGLVGFLDPPRGDVPETIEACRRAGVKVVMVTGDHPETAAYIARQIGLVNDDPVVILGDELDRIDDLDDSQRAALLKARVFARVTPEQKLGLIQLLREQRHIVAMTGDGVNDAPALKRADIGVAMGQRGTEVAREAADMVLQDDALSSIVAAIEHGRAIFDNIRKFVIYLLSCNASEVLVIGLTTLVGGPLPILPLQILYLNLITDVFPALALGVTEGAPDTMTRSPRNPEEAIIDNRHWWMIAGYAGLITISVLSAFFLTYRWLDVSETHAVTTAFVTLAFAQLWHVLNMRSRRSSVLHNEIVRNRYVWGALALSSVLILLAVYLPGLSATLGTTHITGREWSIAIALSLVPTIVGQIVLALSRIEQGEIAGIDIERVNRA